MNDLTRDDLAQLRAIAEDGRRMPLLGGRILILWGVAIAVASLFQWAVIQCILPLPAISLAVGWFAICGGAWALSHLSFFRKRIGKGGNAVERTAWQFAGGFLGLTATALFVAGEWQRGGTMLSPFA